jgi:hypothetical protein
MKIRIFVVLFSLALAACLSTVAQQNPAPQAPAASANSSQSADKCAGCCCQNAKTQAGDSKGSTMGCCHGKSMSCGKKGKDDNAAAMNCCAGKDGNPSTANVCASCCGKSASANNGKNCQNCCTAQHTCCQQNSAKPS